MKYDFAKVEQKWQRIWEEKKVFAASNDYTKPKYYVLVEFPYPSGQGLHVGHPRSYTALDIVARKRRLEGYNVLYPMGWDAFGLPTENYAIKNHIHPEIVTRQNVERFKTQLKSLGLSFDWDREINTTDPAYYRWTQWIFLQLFKKGLAYKKEMSVNWCTGCKVVLANEEVVNGVCERCGSDVVHKVKSQWMLKITEYAQRLIDDLDTVSGSPPVRTPCSARPIWSSLRSTPILKNGRTRFRIWMRSAAIRRSRHASPTSSAPNWSRRKPVLNLRALWGSIR